MDIGSCTFPQEHFTPKGNLAQRLENVTLLCLLIHVVCMCCGLTRRVDRVELVDSHGHLVSVCVCVCVPVPAGRGVCEASRPSSGHDV